MVNLLWTANQHGQHTHRIPGVASRPLKNPVVEGTVADETRTAVLGLSSLRSFGRHPLQTRQVTGFFRAYGLGLGHV
jgi:hypothetical protein